VTIKWGVIGACGIADRRTIPEGITKARNAKLVAVMDVDQDNVKKVAKKYGVSKYYTAEEDLIDDKDVDVVYIATPTHLHYSQVITAATKGKHISCEKPMAMTLEECQEMLDICRKNKVKLGLGFMMRFHVYHKKIKDLIEQGALGKLTLGRAQLSCWYPPIRGAWRQDLKLGGGGSLIDMGSHCIDLLEMFFGKVKEVQAIIGQITHKYPVENIAVVNLRFSNDALGIVDNCFNIPDVSSENRLEVYGTKGSILASGTIGQASTGKMRANLETKEKGYESTQKREVAATKEINLSPVNIYQSEIEAFSDAVASGKEPPISGEDGLWSQKVILACYESAKTGKLIKLK